MAETEQMAIGAFLYPTGYHVAAWRHPDVPADAGIDVRHYIEITRIAERGKFDLIFLPDSAGVRGTDMEALSRTAVRYVAQLEPLTLLGALAVSTERVGLTATVSATYNEPYHAARKIASLDHMSGGRAGWNLVTSQNPEEAFNFGFDAQPDHAERYARAAEFARVVRGLWDTWEDTAFVRDKESGLFFRPEAVAPLNYRSDRFKVRGPLNMPRSPQGHPPTLQAGSSEAGKDLAASSGEVIFTAQPTLQDAQAFYKDVKGRLGAYRRTPGELRILPGVFPFVGRTRQEARDKFEQLQELIDPVVGLGLLSSELGHVDLSGFPLDGPLPPLPPSNAGKGRQKLLVEMAEREQLSIRQLAQRVAGSRGHWQPMGTASDVADELQEWFENEAADGFMIMAPSLPAGLADFVDLVVPELQRRGLFRTEYRGRTLRNHLGLARPSGR
jgi:FMN-dependent oxidoreductase (nitrilotriacetate monooxygenase family)